MTREEQREEQDRRIAIGVTTIFYALMLLFFLFTIVWKAPDPPLPAPGEILVGFGTTSQGFGNTPPRPVSNPNTETVKARPNPQVEERSQPETKPTQSEPKPVVQENPLQHESPAVVNDRKETTRPQERPVEQDRKPQPATRSDDTGDSDKKPSDNRGDVQGAVGNQGRTDGSLNSDALYGGAGEGASLEMAGWSWDEKPAVQDNSSEQGRVQFEVRINNRGEVIGVKLLYREVSRPVASLYEQAVRELTFSPNPGSPRPRGDTVGKITFVIKSR